MVGVFAKSPRGRANALRSKYFSDDRVGMTRISPAATLQSEAAFDSFQPAEVLREPSELDQPIQCPSPESSIMEAYYGGRGYLKTFDAEMTFGLHQYSRSLFCVEGSFQTDVPWSIFYSQDTAHLNTNLEKLLE